MHTITISPLQEDYWDLVLECAQFHHQWIFLDSTQSDSSYSRYSILAHTPLISIALDVDHVKVHDHFLNQDTFYPYVDFLQVLEKYISEFSRFSVIVPSDFECPFQGGFLGYVGYEGVVFNPLFSTSMIQKLSKKSLNYPLAKLVLYRDFYVHDKHVNRSWFGQLSLPVNLKNKPYSLRPFKPLSSLTCLMDYPAYSDAIDTLQTHIQRGDVYQANFTTRFTALTTGSLWDYYMYLRSHSPSPFSAFIRDGEFEIACGSPERFVRIIGREIHSHPIKGTLSSLYSSEYLLNSAKNNAELMMIVDLIRNDLSKWCIPGSVIPDPLVQIETFSQLHHLVSIIKGRLKESVSPVEAILDMLPGGSITGAPKKSAVELLLELESEPRGIYTGIMGYFGLNGCHDFNIAIRTAYSLNGRFYVHAGGGIVRRSTPEEEWEELHIKIAAHLDFFKNNYNF